MLNCLASLLNVRVDEGRLGHPGGGTLRLHPGGARHGKQRPRYIM